MKSENSDTIYATLVRNLIRFEGFFQGKNEFIKK